MAYTWLMVTSGMGMATYRLICFHYLFKKELDTKKIAKHILLAGFLISVSMITLCAWGYSQFGWEKAVLYQFCMNMGPVEVSTIHEYADTENDLNGTPIAIVRIVISTVSQSLLVLELAIYVWILFNLWKHDQKNHSDGIITKDMKRERNQKNVVTLRGQALTFFVETAFNIYIMIHYSDHDVVQASFMPLSLIVVSTVISLIQLITSHEMRRYLKNQFNLY